MKRIIYLSGMVLLLLATVSCKEKEEYDNNHTYPPCMQKDIDEFMSNDKYTMGTIEKCKYKGNIVYIFWKHTANEIIEVVDKDCNLIESILTGGVVGPNPRLEEEFQHIEIVWEYNKIKE